MSGLTLLIYGIAAAGTVCFRTLLQLRSIDMSTGFYFNNGTEVLAFNILLAVVAAVFLLLPRLIKTGGRPSAGIVNSAAKIFLGFVVEVVAFTDIIELVLGGSGTISLLVVASMIISVAAGLVFVFEGFYGLSDQKTKEQNIFNAALPPLWMTVVLLKTFMGYKLTIEISDNMLHILALVSILLFLTNYAKISMGLGNERTQCRTVSTGLLASFFSFVLAVPRLIAGTLGVGFTGGPSTAVTLIVFALGVYSLLSTLPLIKTDR